MAGDDFYSRWFNRKTSVRPLTAQQRWERETNQLKALATSPLGQALVEKFKLPEVEEAEEAMGRALAEIKDQETRIRIDDAVGKIALAYQTLGFCAGHFSQDSRASLVPLADNLLERTNWGTWKWSAP